MKWRKLYLVAPLQFLVSLAATYLVGSAVAKPEDHANALLVAVAVSGGMALIFTAIRLFAGPLDTRGPGPLAKHPSK